MSQRNLIFVFPGDLNTRTGGYLYDKRLMQELESSTVNGVNWNIRRISLEGDYPFPNQLQRERAARVFAELENNALVVVDGLAYSVLPEIVATQAQRLQLIALVHHPLALETGLTGEQSLLLKKQETQALAHARHVITTSKLTASSLHEYGVPADKVTAILPGNDDAPLALGSGTETLNLLCVATLTQRKAHHILLDALASIKELPWHLYCVGSTSRDSQTYKELEKKREQHALLQRVTFTGELQEHELQEYYMKADVFVLASLHEGYGMVLSEAITYGLPIVCTNAGAMPDTVPTGAGMLVPPSDVNALANALKNIIANTTLRAQLQSAALKARERRRSWQQAAADFSALPCMSSKT